MIQHISSHSNDTCTHTISYVRCISLLLSLSPPFTPTSHHTASHHIKIMYQIAITSLSRHRQCEHGSEGFYMLSGRPHRQRQEDSHAGHSLRSGQVRYRHHCRGAPCSHSLATSHLSARIYYPHPTPNTPLLTLPYSSHLSFSILLLSPLRSFLPTLPPFLPPSLSSPSPSLPSPPLCRAVKLVHVADLISGSTSETISHLQAIVQDARLADAMVAIDG